MDSSTQLEQYRKRGNDAYVRRDFRQAVKEYTSALAIAPNVAALWTNRSAAYYMLKLYAESLNDAKKAVDVDPSWVKGWYRLGQAQLKLGRYYESLRSLRKCLELDSSNTSAQDALKEAQIALTEWYHLNITKRLSQGAVIVKHVNDKVGRGVFANKSFKRGDIIFVEDPLVSHRLYDSKSASQNLDSCSHCLRTILKPEHVNHHKQLLNRMYGEKLPSFIPCNLCGESDLTYHEKYCSEKCKAAAWRQYHKLLCPLNASNTSLQGASHPLHVIYEKCRAHGKVNPLIVMRMMADVILRMVDDKLPLDEAIQPYRFFGSVTEPEGPEVFLGQEVVEALRLLTSHIEHDLSEVLNISVYREFHGIILRNAQSLFPVSDLHLLLNSESPDVQQNIVNLFDSRLDPAAFVASEFMVARCVQGTGLYAIANSINHSCSPNAMSVCSHNSHALSVIALRDISRGEEIVISYIDEDAPLQDRQKKLKTYYLFECECPKCIQQGGKQK